MMTEEEAKKKWCPFSRVSTSDAETPVSWNRIEGSISKADTLQFNVGADIPASCCIGSACMAWRWHARAEAVGDAVEWKRDTGYCGLAGKDEK